MAHLSPFSANVSGTHVPPQHYGHPSKWVRCGENYKTTTCVKALETPLKYTNCDREYTTNHRKYQAFSAITQSKIKTTIKSLQQPLNVPTQFTRTLILPSSKGNTIFAQVVLQKAIVNKSTVTIPTRYLMKILTNTIKKISESNNF